MSQVTIKINGHEVKAEKGEPILGPIRAQGIDIPTLCHMDGVEPYGACRLCMVEVGKGDRAKLVTSCNFPAREGLEIQTDTERVHRDRAMLAELLLARSPGVKKVQELAVSLGVKKARFKTMEPTECLLCGLCVRVCNEIVGASAIGFEGRGVDRVVGTPFFLDPDACIACGACTEVCPTGIMQMEIKTKERWKKELVGNQRLCRYARMGLVPYKVCPNDFDCATCEVDQRLWDEMGMHPVLALAPGKKRKPRQVGNFVTMLDRFYSKGHVWVKPLGERVIVGLDDFAQKVIGDISSITIGAKPGDVVHKGKDSLNVACNGHSAAMLFPISGTIKSINPAMDDEPTVINEDCYRRGWLFTVEPTDQYRETKDLVASGQVEPWMLEESDFLFKTLSEVGGAALSDGGELLPNFSRELADDEWDRIAKRFFSKV
ncbi:MAG: 2Fe-2S iron-sulfur cluster binding domain-containing protein [Deltaproteobacteria bacterium]|nr:2Fe-2S iron-sulfur cluster binding domain-containing protein [Deltaproteobacteria bacterium]